MGKVVLSVRDSSIAFKTKTSESDEKSYAMYLIAYVCEFTVIGKINSIKSCCFYFLLLVGFNVDSWLRRNFIFDAYFPISMK